MLTGFRKRFWQPPRAHGEIIEDRTVSSLELFYDLVYVVVIARAAHTLAEHISWRTVGEFVVIFGLTWMAWINGTLYYELHGREDGRTRSYVFLQMLLLALLAVFTGHAADTTGAEFAVVYSLFLALITWLWYTVRRQDTPEYAYLTSRYLGGLIASIILVGVSAGLSDELRVVAWGLVVAGWFAGWIWLNSRPEIVHGFVVTDAMLERYGLFVIIVLGEVVVGVVEGLSAAAHSKIGLVTGMLSLGLGFAYWWTFFDLAGRRRPIDSAPVRGVWILAHLPATMSIAAGGAAMVSLIEHAGDRSTPAPTAWLLTGSATVGLAALIVNLRTLEDARTYPVLFRPVMTAMGATAGLALVLGYLAPAPWAMVLLLDVAFSVLWFYAVSCWLKAGAPAPNSHPVPEGSA